MIRVTHPRMHLLPLGRVAAHHVHWCRKPQAHLLDGTIHFQPVCRCGVRLLESCLITLGFFGDATDWDDSICAGGRLAALPLTFPIVLRSCSGVLGGEEIPDVTPARAASMLLSMPLRRDLLNIEPDTRGVEVVMESLESCNIMHGYDNVVEVFRDVRTFGGDQAQAQLPELQYE